MWPWRKKEVIESMDLSKRIEFDNDSSFGRDVFSGDTYLKSGSMHMENLNTGRTFTRMGSMWEEDRDPFK